MKRDQLDTQRHGKEGGGDRIKELVDKVQGWRNEADAEGTRLNLLEDPEHGYFSEVEAYDKVLGELRATAATPTEPPNMDEREIYVMTRIRNVLAVLFAGAPMDNLTPEIQKMVCHWQQKPNGKRDLDGLREPFTVRKCAGWCLEVTFAADPPGAIATHLVANFGDNERHARQIMDSCNRAALAAPKPDLDGLREALDRAVNDGMQAAIHDVTTSGGPFRYSNREIFRYGNYAACMMDIRREVTEYVLAALAAQRDPLGEKHD